MQTRQALEAATLDVSIGGSTPNVLDRDKTAVRLGFRARPRDLQWLAAFVLLLSMATARGAVAQDAAATESEEASAPASQSGAASNADEKNDAGDAASSSAAAEGGGVDAVEEEDFSAYDDDAPASSPDEAASDEASAAAASSAGAASPAPVAAGGLPPGALVLGAGVGVALLGGVSGAWVLHSENRLAAVCDETGCPSQWQSTRTATDRIAAASIGLLIGGGVTAAIGATLWALGVGAHHEQASSSSVGLTCAPSGCTVRLSGSF